MFKNPFSFEGRIRRTEYGITSLIYLVVYLFMLAAVQLEPLVLLVLVPLLWFMWAQGAKRCHDRGNSGWWQIIPFYNLWMLFADGNEGENEYGPDPKGRIPFESYDFTAKPVVEADDNISTQPE